MNIFKKALTIGSGKLATELNAQIDSINSKEEEVTKLTDTEIKCAQLAIIGKSRDEIANVPSI